jgi:hypothetical protein
MFNKMSHKSTHNNDKVSRRLIVNGKMVTVEWTPYDFSQYGFSVDDVLNYVGVFCPDDEQKLVQIGIKASNDYAAWATLHEEMCRRGRLLEYFPDLVNNKRALDSHHPEHCRLVEEKVMETMVMYGDENYTFADYRRDRLTLLQRILPPNMSRNKETEKRLKATRLYLETAG